MSTVTGSSFTTLIVEYYEKKLLSQPEFKNDLLKYGVKAMIPKGNSDVIHWNRITRFGRAQSVTDGTDLSTERTPEVTEVKGKLELYGDFVKITPYGDELRIASMIDASYDEFIMQASREANYRLQSTLIAGDSSTGNSFPACTAMFAGNASGFTDLDNSGSYVLTAKDVERAVHFIRKNQGKGQINVITNAWGYESLLLDDKFRTIVSNQDLKILKESELPRWGGAKVGWNDDPWREALTSEGGAAGTYSSTGKVFTTWVFGEEAFGTVQLMGRGGLRPRFKAQDISIIGNLVTIGYFLPFKGGALNSNWIVGLRHVSGVNSSVASFV